MPRKSVNKASAQPQLVIISDIFGQTQALQQFAEQLQPHSLIIDPYQGQEMAFNNEKLAYEYFSQSVGLETYLQQANSVITSINSELFVIGFSVGASVLWQLSANYSSQNIKGAWCFYGSQIRHHTQLQPNFDIELMLPSSEAHFDVQKLTQTLACKPKVILKQTEFLHGFMNPHSDNFNHLAYQQYLDYLTKAIQHVS